MTFQPNRVKKLREEFPTRWPLEFRSLFPDPDKTEFSQQDLAHVIGTAQQQISRYERGERQPDATMAVKLADALKTSMDYLFGRTDNPAELTYANMTDVERNAVDAARRGLLTTDGLLLAQELSKLPDPVRNKIRGIARSLQE